MDAPPAYSASAPEKAMSHLWESETCLWNPLTFEAQMVPQPETQAGRQFERTALFHHWQWPGRKWAGKTYREDFRYC